MGAEAVSYLIFRLLCSIVEEICCGICRVYHFGQERINKVSDMLEDRIQIYCGTGSGKSAAAIGQGLRRACHGESVFIVRFLKGKVGAELEYVRRLEPEIKLFSFDKFDGKYCELDEEEKQEERLHILNGLNYAKKVIVTSECDVLILDEFLDLIEMGIVTAGEAVSLIEAVGDEMSVILTGTACCEELWPYVDRVTEISTRKPV